ncbi:MAG TPA: SdiA-regulated domain-containing protein, partial [Flavisolibacter sp.]
LLKNDDEKFDPSAAAIHPINKRLYILASAGSLLVVTDTRGKVVAAYMLNQDLFPQPEGIAFAPNGDMYISNEGRFGKPTLLLFPYQQKGQKQKREK